MKNSYQNHFKIEVLQYISKGNSIAKASRKFKVHPSTVYAWTKIGLNGFLDVVECDNDKNNAQSVKLAPSVALRIEQLEQENEVLRQTAKLYFKYN